MQGSFLQPPSPDGFDRWGDDLWGIFERLGTSAEPGRLAAKDNNIVVLISFDCAIYFAQRQEEGMGALL